MKTLKITQSAMLVAGVCSLLLSGCKAKVDLENIDPSAEVKLGMALPVATASVTLGDFMGDDKLLNQIQVGTGTDKTVGENGVDKGVLFFRNESESDKDYHKIDLKHYLQDVTSTFKIADKFSGTSIPAGTTTKLVFPLNMKLVGINDDFGEERLDKMSIESANFISKINVTNLNIKKEDIEKVEIVLYGKERTRSGKTLSEMTQGYFEKTGHSPLSDDYVFEVKGFNKVGFGKDIPIEIDKFDVIMMKEYKETFKSRREGNENVTRDLGFDFVFYLKPSTAITINSNSAFEYQFIIDFLDYSALYGFFNPSNLMRDKKTDTISNIFEEWSSIKNLKLALAKPRIDLDITTAIAAPLMVNVTSLSVSNEKGENRNASFNEAGTQYEKQYPFYQTLSINDPFDKTVTNSFFLNEETDRGNLDYLFLIQPDYMHWDYGLEIQQNGDAVQHRLTDNTMVHTKTTVTIPFQFLKGMILDYTDTTEIDWAGMSLDSLTSNIEYIDSIGTSNAKVRLKVDNTIPLDVCLRFEFLDDKDKPIDMSGLEITIDGTAVGDSIIIKAATNIESSGNVANVNGEQVATSTKIWMNLSADQFNKITQAKKMKYTASINTSDQSFHDNKWVNVRNVSGLSLQLGVAADVDAFLRLDLNGNKDK